MRNSETFQDSNENKRMEEILAKKKFLQNRIQKLREKKNVGEMETR